MNEDRRYKGGADAHGNNRAAAPSDTTDIKNKTQPSGRRGRDVATPEAVFTNRGREYRHSDESERKYSRDGERRHSDEGERKYSRDGERRHSDEGERRRSRDGERRHSDEGERKYSRDGERRHSSRRRRKRFSPNTAFVLIVVSGILALIIVICVLASHIKIMSENKTEEEETTTVAEVENESEDNKEISVARGVYNLEYKEVMPETEFPVVKVYDENGNVEICPLREANGYITATVVYGYDENGTRLYEKKYGRDGVLVYKEVTGGKEDGVAKTLYETEFDQKNNYSGFSETFFDENGDVLMKVKHSSNGVVEGKYDYQYDEAGRVIRENRYTTYGELSMYTEYKYDANGNNTEVIQVDASGKEVFRDVMEYDSKNRLVLEEHYTVGVCKNYSEYTYDEYGNPIKKNYVLMDEYTMTYKEVP